MFCIQTNLISVDGLSKVIPSNQLTDDFDGTLPYDNKDWVDVRIVGFDYICLFLIFK